MRILWHQHLFRNFPNSMEPCQLGQRGGTESVGFLSTVPQVFNLVQRVRPKKTLKRSLYLWNISAVIHIWQPAALHHLRNRQLSKDIGAGHSLWIGTYHDAGFA